MKTRRRLAPPADPGKTTRRSLPGLLLASLLGASMYGSAATVDPLLAPPPGTVELVPVPDLDLSDAEARAREAIEAARDAVRAQFEHTAAAASDQAEAYGRLGGLYHAHDIPGGAAPAYRNARRLAPEHFRWAYLDAWLAQGVGRLGDAMEAYEAAQAIDATYPPLALRLGEVLLELNRPQDAAKYLHAALAEPGLEAAAAFRLGRLALQRRDFTEAESWLRRSLDADPGAEAPYTALAMALRAQGYTDAAREALARGGERQPLAEDRIVRELEDLNSGARRHFLRGLLAVREGRFAEGVEAFGEGLAEDPDNLSARISHARALYLAGRRSDARAELETVLERRPGEPLAAFLLGLLLEVQGDLAGARNLYRLSIAAQPDHPGASHHLGLLDFRDGAWQSAALLLTQASRRLPDNVIARVLALIAASRAGGETAEIAAGLEAITAEHPRQPLPRYALSRLRSAAENPAIRDPGRGLELAEGLLAADPIPPVYEALALARAASGDPAGARVALENAQAAYRRSGALIFLPRLEPQFARLAAGELPSTAWPTDDPVLAPPPTDPRGVFQEYPTPRPF
jgi:protein O-mannosyl-transferase